MVSVIAPAINVTRPWGGLREKESPLDSNVGTASHYRYNSLEVLIV